MTFDELLEKVNEDEFDKHVLEHYHSELCSLKARFHRELAQLKKEKALFMVKRDAGVSIASRKEEWDATPRGQRKFDMEGYIASAKSAIDSVKSKLYSFY